MKKLMTIFIVLVFGSITWGQTVLISPTGDGGFETGLTPAANNWTAVNSTTDGWYVGAVPVVSAGVNCGYISSTAGVDWTYSQTSAIQHLYYDVTIPAGESKITLTFKWKVMGEGTTTSDWDNMKVFFALSSAIGVPVANTAISSTYQISGVGAVNGMYKLNSTAWNSETIMLTGIPGSTYRLVFSWKSDGSGIYNPPASIDEVSLTSEAPDPLHGVYSIDNTMLTTTPMVHDGTGNFASFTAAINYMNSEGISDDVTFNVPTGLTFIEDCPPITATGTVDNPITFRKWGSGANPIIQPTGTTGTADAGIIITGGDYITFDGIDISIAAGSAVEYGYAIRNATAIDGAKYNTVKNCKITLNRVNTNSKGIYQYRFATASDTNGANSHNRYQNITIENSYMGIYVNGSSTYPDMETIIIENIIGAATANDIGGGTIATNGIRASYQSDISIGFNTVRNVNSTTAAVYGIYLESGQGANAIYNNRVVSSGILNNVTTVVYGIRTDINSGHSVYIVNNMVSDLYHGRTSATTTQVIRGMAIGVSGTGTGYFYYNSVLISEDAFPSSTAMFVGGGTVTLLNNIFANTSTAGATSKRHSFYRNSGTIISDYNDLYIDIAGTNNFTGYYSADQNSLANWQTASGQDAHSIAVNPTFTSITDLHTTNAALNGVGTPITGITSDFDGEARDAMFPDMGADENLLPPSFTCTTPTPGNTFASSTDLCYGEGVLLTLQNATPGTGVGYQWQSSTNGIIYSNIAGATTNSYSTVPTVPTFFQCIVTCYNGPETGTSTPVLVEFAHDITSATGASRCGTGSVTLWATGTAGTTITWFDSVADTIVGTGSPWETPIISTTTVYNVAAVSTAPALVPIGAGASTLNTYPNPFYSLWSNVHTQHMIKKEELIAAGLSAGNITSLALDFTSAGTLPTIDLAIKIGTSSASDMSAFVDNSLFSLIYTNASYMPTPGVNTFTFLTPFYWDGNSNIVLEFCHGNGASSATMSRTVKADPTSFVSSVKTHVSSATAAAVICPDVSTNLASYSVRPQFILAGQGACFSPSVEVTATIASSPILTISADQSVCNNTSAQIDVTSTLTDYDSYVWTPENDLYTDAACTNLYISGASATTVYVKSTTAVTTTYTCTANNSVSQCSNIATSAVTTLPAAPVATAAPSDICVSGATIITVDPAVGYGDATFQWQGSTDNVTFTDIAGANSISYTTPTITSTTYYKLLIKLGAAVCTESNVVTVTVNNPQIVSTTPGSRCGTGTVILGATGSVGTTLNWYAAVTGGISLGSGNSFTTPIISSTTDYYVGAETSVPANITIGPGTFTSSYNYVSPFYHSYGGLKSQYLISSSELAAAGLVAGNLTALSFNIASAGISYNDFNLSIGTTSLTNLPSTFQTGLTNVYSAASVTPTVGIYTITFATPYLWDGTSNIIVETCWSNNNYGGTAANVKYDYTAFVSTAYNRLDNTPASTLCASTTTYGTLSQRPQIIFAGQGVCSNPRVAVTATVTAPPAITVSATPSSICVNQNSSLDVTSTNDPNYTYEWMPGNLTGANQTVSPTTTTTYSVTASDNSGGLNDGCVATDTVIVTVKPIPEDVFVTPSSAAVCAGGIQQLDATGGQMMFTGILGTGTATNTTTTPYKGYWGGNKSQFIYTASELTAMGMVGGHAINSIAFSITSFTGPYTFTDFTIGMKNTSSTDLSAGFETGVTTVLPPESFVLTGTAPFTLTHTLSTPFVWDGTSNLLVETCFCNHDGGGASANSANVVSTSMTNMARYYSNDTETTVCSAPGISSTSSSRPNITLSYGITTEMTWSPLNDLYTDALATVPYTGTPATTVYVKPTSGSIITATSIAANACTNAATASITLNPLPTAVNTISDNVICAGDPVTISIALSGNGPWLLHGLTKIPATGALEVLPDTTVTSNPFIIYDNPQEDATYHLESFTDLSTNCSNDTANWLSVMVNPLPTAVLSADQNTVCSGTTVNFSIDLTGTGPWLIQGLTMTKFDNIEQTMPDFLVTSSPYLISQPVASSAYYHLESITDQGTGCTTDTANWLTVIANQPPEVSDVTLLSSTDQATWTAVSGDLASGYSMCINPATPFHYLDINTL
ncbi:MAG: hypothetical protein KAZ36_02775, partial [Bacteroidales bacterium]|nr:hypothetical protein [Bacteroidales bacterium]